MTYFNKIVMLGVFRMKYATPESVGIKSSAIESFMRTVENNRLAMHSIVIARGDSIVYKAYYPPFTAEKEHRLYSVTKSFVAIAVGFAIDDGLLTIDDLLCDHFPAEAKLQNDSNFLKLTIRNMLMMATAGMDTYWFDAIPEDRVAHYFQSEKYQSHPGGTYFSYDSSGSFVMGALVERLTGKDLVTYLSEKLFDKIGVKGPVRCLKCPGGHSWGDSAFLMRSEDLLLVMKFLMNGGSWNGEQLLSADFVKEATSNLISTGDRTVYKSFGYGYYIWQWYDMGYSFNGMGSEFAVAIPEKDMIFVCTGDTQGNPDAGEMIFANFRDLVVKTVGAPLCEDEEAQKSLAEYTNSLKLLYAKGECLPDVQSRVSGKKFVAGSENPMGITEFSLDFDGSTGVFNYKNAQGDKSLAFKICENSFQKFPQTGYADQIGTVSGNKLYDCAVSGAWNSDSVFLLKLQIIDDYLGNMDAAFTFDEDYKSVRLEMKKAAEDFLKEYQGSGYFDLI